MPSDDAPLGRLSEHDLSVCKSFGGRLLVAEQQLVGVLEQPTLSFRGFHAQSYCYAGRNPMLTVCHVRNGTFVVLQKARIAFQEERVALFPPALFPRDAADGCCPGVRCALAAVTVQVCCYLHMDSDITQCCVQPRSHCRSYLFGLSQVLEGTVYEGALVLHGLFPQLCCRVLGCANDSLIQSLSATL